MNRKELWLEEMSYNLHQQDFINGKSGKEILKVIMEAIKIRMKYEVQMNTIEFLNEEIN